MCRSKKYKVVAVDERSLGTLQLFRTQKQRDDRAKDIAVLQSYNVPFQMLGPGGCVVAEPGLAGSADTIVGGLRLPADETGDCFKFTAALAERARAAGVNFQFGTQVLGLEADGGRIRRVRTDRGSVVADGYIVALGSYSAQMLRPLGLRLPVYPVKGYSIIVPIVDADRAPVSTVMDESYKIAITRLGDRTRVGGMAEISGYSHDLPPRRRATLAHSLNGLFGGAGDMGGASYWSGLRTMTPDGTPVIGATGYDNLYLNTGHGTLGWNMACGSGHVLADIIGGRKPAIEHGDLSISRYGRL